MNPANGSHPQPDAATIAVVEANFWKQKYFELLTHSNQVIAMLAMTQNSPVPPGMPGQPQPPMPSQNGAQNGAQPQESASEK